VETERWTGWSAEVRRRLPAFLLVVGAVALAVSVPVVLAEGSATKELPWIAGTAIFLVAATIVYRRRPGSAVARWFAVAAGLVGVVQAFDAVLLRFTATLPPSRLAWWALTYQLVSVAGGIALTHLLGLFPDGRPERPFERRLLRALWWLVPIPLLGLVTTTSLVLPSYHQAGTIANPYQLDALAWAGPLVGGVLSVLQGVFVLGVVLLVPRYRRADRNASGRSGGCWSRPCSPPAWR
jgi:hypothetical protein